VADSICSCHACRGGRDSRLDASGWVGPLGVQSRRLLAHSLEHLSEICDVVLRLLGASVVHSVHIDQWDSRHGLLINAPTFAHLMERCQSLKALKLEDLNLDDIHCRVLGTYSSQTSRSILIAVDLRVLEQVLCQRSLDAIRDRPGLLGVILTIPFSRTGYAEIVVSKASHLASVPTASKMINDKFLQSLAPSNITMASLTSIFTIATL
jgi:hypothetical protein